MHPTLLPQPKFPTLPAGRRVGMLRIESPFHYSINNETIGCASRGWVPLLVRQGGSAVSAEGGSLKVATRGEKE